MDEEQNVFDFCLVRGFLFFFFSFFIFLRQGRLGCPRTLHPPETSLQNAGIAGMSHH
jgi:hypothetical protein